MSQLLSRFLGSGDALSRLQEHAAHLRRLQAALERGLPTPLAGLCQVANFKAGTLILSTRGGAAAARLRQLTPSLVEHLTQAGYAVQSIKVKVAPPEQYAWRRPPPERHISADARATLTGFAATLPDDSPLRAALERLALRSRE